MTTVYRIAVFGGNSAIYMASPTLQVKTGTAQLLVLASNNLPNSLLARDR